ncbi:unnamed protein product [Notodromas monacha]|uniref:Uncharacterized protein n=1 Tax=Notodromas monacha TaxID=399045 RepID=A0A7R9GFU8_9CRUS|nr:unnamed protein product [Notodromas monacha]CAG0919718.1 unnamed protein product [Notodromas monacha]
MYFAHGGSSGAVERRQYLQRMESFYQREDGYSISLLLSLTDLHFMNDSFCVENISEFPIANILSYPLVEIVEAHLRQVHCFCERPGVENLENGVSWQVNALAAATRFVSQTQDKNWPIPILVTVARDLRRLTFKLMSLKKTLDGVEDDDDSTKRDPSGVASDAIMSAFRVCASDVRTAEAESKRWGMLGLVNQMLRIYAKGGHLELYRPLMRAIDSITMKDKFPVAQMVTYKYLVGQKHVFDGEFHKAAEKLTYAFERCMKSNVGNKRRILLYLIPTKMILGQMPKLLLLKKYNLEQFEEVTLAVKQGNVRRLNEALETNHDFFVEHGIYLILEKLLTMTCRNLFKKIFLLFNSHQIDILLFERALRFLGMEDVDTAETQCIVANLIDEGRIKGYISLKHNKLKMNNGNVSDPVGRAVCDLSPVPTVHHVQALYPFKGSNNDELCFRKGDIITVTQMEEGGWWEGTLRGRTGWFPSNYVKECEPGTEVGIGSSSTSSPSSSALLAPQQQFANRVKILETFIEAERAFLLEMDNFLLQMVPPLRNHKVNLDDLSSLFTDLERLVAAHRTLMTTVVTESRRQSCDANGNDAGSGFSAGPRIGKIFLQNAAELQAVHTVYSRAHPKAVGVIDKFRDEINAHLMKATSGAGGVIVLIKKLSGPFRRLSQFPPFLQEWKGQLEDSNPDRGDSQRAAQFFRDVVAECSAHRREAELELEVMNGNFTDWDSGQCPLPKQLGPILKMSRALIMWDGLRSKEKTAAHRFLLAFARQLVVLSTAPTMTSFVFQGNIPFTHVTSIEVLDDVEGRSFSLEGPNMDKLTATFEQKVECTDWVHLVEKQTGCTSAGAAVATHRRQSSLDLREVSVDFLPYEKLTDLFLRLRVHNAIPAFLVSRFRRGLPALPERRWRPKVYAETSTQTERVTCCEPVDDPSEFIQCLPSTTNEDPGDDRVCIEEIESVPLNDTSPEDLNHDLSRRVTVPRARPRGLVKFDFTWKRRGWSVFDAWRPETSYGPPEMLHWSSTSLVDSCSQHVSSSASSFDNGRNKPGLRHWESQFFIKDTPKGADEFELPGNRLTEAPLAEDEALTDESVPSLPYEGRRHSAPCSVSETLDFPGGVFVVCDQVCGSLDISGIGFIDEEATRVSVEISALCETSANDTEPKETHELCDLTPPEVVSDDVDEVRDHGNEPFPMTIQLGTVFCDPCDELSNTNVCCHRLSPEPSVSDAKNRVEIPENCEESSEIPHLNVEETELSQISSKRIEDINSQTCEDATKNVICVSECSDHPPGCLSITKEDFSSREEVCEANDCLAATPFPKTKEDSDEKLPGEISTLQNDERGDVMEIDAEIHNSETVCTITSECEEFRSGCEDVQNFDCSENGFDIPIEDASRLVQQIFRSCDESRSNEQKTEESVRIPKVEEDNRCEISVRESTDLEAWSKLQSELDFETQSKPDIVPRQDKSLAKPDLIFVDNEAANSNSSSEEAEVVVLSDECPEDDEASSSIVVYDPGFALSVVEESVLYVAPRVNRSFAPSSSTETEVEEEQDERPIFRSQLYAHWYCWRNLNAAGEPSVLSDFVTRMKPNCRMLIVVVKRTCRNMMSDPSADARAATETFRRGGSLRVGSCSKPTAMFPVTPQSVPKASIVKQAEVEPKKSAMVMGVEPQLREEAPWREGMTQIFHAGENLIAEVVDAYCRLKCAAISQGPFSMGFEEESAVDAMQIVDSYPNMSSG